jgi:hypothetical protein
MQRRQRNTRRAVIALGATAALAAPATASAAEQVVAATESNRLVTFVSSSPGNIERAVPITQLAAGDQIVALDVRPSNGQLYGLGSSSRIYRLNPLTGEAAQVGTQPFTPTLAGTSFGFDFNPTVDRIRLISDAEQSLRLSPETGESTSTDGTLSYAAGDAGAGTNPSAGGAAYSNNAADADATNLYAIDTGRDVLVRQDPPNAGTLNTVGALTVDAVEPVGFDVAGTNRAIAALRLAGQPQADLYAIDLATGKATPTAAQSRIGTFKTDGTADAVRAITLLGQSPDDRTAPDVSIGLSSTKLDTTLLSEGFLHTLSCNEACTEEVVVRVGRRIMARGTGAVLEGPASERIPVDLTATGRARVRARPTTLFRLNFVVRDAAGNEVTRERTVRGQTLEGRRAGG